MSVSPDFNETWGTHTLPQVIILRPISGQSVIWLWTAELWQIFGTYTAVCTNAN